MRTFRRIVHPSDFSPASRPAFRKAIELAKSHRAQLLRRSRPVDAAGDPRRLRAPHGRDEPERGQRITAQREPPPVATAKAAGARASVALIDIGVTHEQIGRFGGRDGRPDRDRHPRSQRPDEGAPGERRVASLWPPGVPS